MKITRNCERIRFEIEGEAIIQWLSLERYRRNATEYPEGRNPFRGRKRRRFTDRTYTTHPAAAVVRWRRVEDETWSHPIEIAAFSSGPKPKPAPPPEESPERTEPSPTLHTRATEAAVEIDVDTIVGLIRLNNGGQLQPWFFDRKYWVPLKSHFFEALAEDRTDELKYVAERWDCDDFSVATVAGLRKRTGCNAVALVVDASAGHAYICAVVAPDDTDDPRPFELLVIEPQADRVEAFGRPKYDATEGWMFW